MGKGMTVPDPVRLYRLVHIDCLPTLLRRQALHAPHFAPDDGLEYKTIHDIAIQERRHHWQVPCGVGGAIHDYLPFYLGPLSPMLYKLSKSGVGNYHEGQQPLIYLVFWATEIAEAGLDYVFSDGHGIAKFTQWFDDLAQLDQVDWPLVLGRGWADDPEDPDRKRRKQAEFLIHKVVPWSMIKGIAVINDEIAARVNDILDQFPDCHRPQIRVVRRWYY